MKNRKKSSSVVLALTVLVFFLILVLSASLVSKGSKDLNTPNTEIKVEPFYGAEYSDIEIPSELTSSSTYSVNLTVKNTGTETWVKDGGEPVRISYHWKYANETVIYDGLRTFLPYNVSSGDTVNSRVMIKTPDQEGNYTLVIDLVKEGVTWFELQGAKPFEKEIEISKRIPEQQGKLEYRTDYPEINKLQALILNTTNSSATVFVDDGNQVFGFYAGSGYPQIWVRDSATVIQTGRYLFPETFFSSWIEAFCENQLENGSIPDYISPYGSDKNTVETDQEASLVHSAYLYYKMTGNTSWLEKPIQGKRIIDRLDGSLVWVLTNRYDSSYGLITGAYTADWGDVQFEDTPGTHVSEKTHWTCDIYDNSFFFQACNELSLMYSDLEENERAIFWADTAVSVKENTNKHLWQQEKGYYRMHVRVSPVNQGFNEDEMFPMGGNVIAIQAGLANHTQAEQIFETAQERKEQVNASTIGSVLIPAYPAGFFANPVMDEEYEYQNGGQWDWFAGRLVLEEFTNGRHEDAVAHLREIANQDNNLGGLYEWYTLNGTGRGSPLYLGSAGVLGQCVIEGYFGIDLSARSLVITPGLGTDNGSISLYEPASDTWLSYNYTAYQNNTILFDYETNYPGEIRFNFPVPENKRAYMDADIPLKTTYYENEKRKYLTFSSESNRSVYKIVYS
ncbi:trehalase family glycosidase [Methanosarcina sp. T3]|uniref:alpha-L-rhamnosidase-related protein n=1 Tax=Methanosarcina sp. T3 TaxID=3439062 RepID=UPI003F82BB85